ncbi:MAG: efflux transporter outer membrane subunit [Candidatus Sumerlaeia bacterium]|nr:efflux transporter outer membrane subunit [Candidatus Sumerlaeia bacterium]
MGCKTTKPEVPVPVVAPETFGQSGLEVLNERWWEDFGDAELNKLVEEALSGNFSLAASWERLSQAESQARAAGVNLYPTLNSTGSFTRTLEKREIETPRAGQDPSVRVDYPSDRRYAFGLSANYELDLWGRIRSGRNAARLDAEARLQDVQTAAVTLSANVATTYFRLREQEGQIALLTRQMETTESTLSLLETRFSQGRSGAADVLQQRQLLESRKEEIRRAERERRVLEISLATLLGRIPEGFSQPGSGELPTPPPLPVTGVPSEWILERPDLRSSMLAVQSADQRLAQALADRYPRVSLTGSFSTSDRRWRDLFDNWLASLAANVSAPILDGGSRKIEVQRNQAVVLERLNNYGQAVVDALAEVETALVQEEEQRAIITSIEEQLRLATQVEERVQAEFIRGALEYLRVLDAQQSRQNLERELLSARQQILQFRIALYRALSRGVTMQKGAVREDFQQFLREPDLYPLPLTPPLITETTEPTTSIQPEDTTP